jgi:U2 small nuclear ribonucleoprotein B''
MCLMHSHHQKCMNFVPGSTSSSRFQATFMTDQHRQDSPFSHPGYPFPGAGSVNTPTLPLPQQSPGVPFPQGIVMNASFPTNPNMIPFPQMVPSQGMMPMQGMFPFPQMSVPRSPVMPGALPTQMPSPAPRPPSVEIGIPSCTVYVQNLDDHLNPKHTLIPALKRLFTPFGRVRRITCKRSLLVKGQAWIEFSTIDEATEAIKTLQSKKLFQKSMILRYARSKPFWLAKREGTLEQERRRRDQAKMERARFPRLTRRQLLAQMSKNPAMLPVLLNPSTTHPAIHPGLATDVGPPNKTLFLQGIPEGVTEAELNNLYKRFPGFDEVRAVPNRADVAFVEFGTEMQAAVARGTTDNLIMRPNQPAIRVIFARR